MFQKNTEIHFFHQSARTNPLDQKVLKIQIITIKYKIHPFLPESTKMYKSLHKSTQKYQIVPEVPKIHISARKYQQNPLVQKV